MKTDERIQEIDKQIALLKAEKAQLNGSTDSFADLKDYFAVQLGNTGVTRGGAHVLYGRQHEAWEHLRKLSIYMVCDNHTKIKDLSIEDWKKSRIVLKALVDYYVRTMKGIKS